MNKRIFHFVGASIAFALFTIAVFVIHKQLQAYHYHAILKGVASIPHRAVALAMLFTAFNFCVLGIYEILGFRYIKNKLPWQKTLLTSFLAYSFSNNVGFYSISGSAVRYRLYSQWGLSTLDIAKLVAFSSGITFWLGLCVIGGLVFILEPIRLPSVLHLPFTSIRIIGWLFMAPPLAFFVLTIIRKKPLIIRSWEFEPPSPALTLVLVITACFDWIFFAAVLYFLLPTAHLSFPVFLSIFLAAQVIGLASHVPGGIGVFDSIIILLLPDVPASTCMSALLVFRGIYYLLPLGISALLLGGRELLQRGKRIATIAQSLGQWGSASVPAVYSALTFIGGVILLVSGATPAEHQRMHWLTHIVPFPVLEISHFMASLFGVALLILSRGLYRRFDSAWHMTMYLLAGGAVFTFVKGLDYEEALILAAMLVVFLPSRRHFYRKASFIHDRFSFGWFMVIFFVMLSAVWLGFFSHQHLSYAGQLWWQIDLNGHASRFLRASIGGCVFLFGFGLYKLLSPSKKLDLRESGAALEAVRTVVASSSRSYAFLALLGDKKFLMSETGDAFIMYAVQGRTWVSMGDPVGNIQSHSSLIWNFKELSDRHGGRMVFYEIGTQNLHHYLDVGLTLLKIGEEARVDLDSLSLEGGSKKHVRHVIRKIEQEGWKFRVIPANEAKEFLPALKTVSDDWLLNKKAREKRFSLGNFSPAYLGETPIAVVSKDGRITAFANLWPTGVKEELSIDLMRYGSDSPSGVMEYLLFNIMTWSKQFGFKWFNLGMAPLSGFDTRAIAPLWNRIGAYLFTHGEEFYNFQGLRQFKEKFGPVWEPKYIAVPGGFSLPIILKDIAALVSGGLKGVFFK